MVVVLALAGAATALAAARDPGVTAPAPERIARSAVHSVTNAPEADATAGAPWSAHRVSPDSTSTLSETGVPETGVPSKAAAPPDSPTAPSLVQTGPVGADAVLETVNSPALPEGHGLQVNAAARAARDAAGRNGAGPPAQAAPVTSFDITLSPGANLISLPLVPDDIGIEAVLTGILDRVETVWQYDTSGAVPRWRSYAPGAPSDLRVMRDGLGYWVLLKDGGAGDAVLTVTGREETGPARRVARGWNLVGYTSTSPQSPGGYLGALGGSAGTTMLGYAGGVAELVLPRAATPQLMPGRGYWLYLEAAGTIGGAPPKTMAVPADRQEPVVLEHESGARIEIPPGATAGALGEDGAETVTVTIQEVEPPAESILNVGPVFGFSIVDQDGDEVPLREAVKITLPYTLPEDKNAADVIMLHWDEGRRRWESAGSSSEEPPPRARGSVERKSAGGDGGMTKGGRVDEASGTITAEVEHLSDYAVALFLAPVEYMAVSGLSVVGRELFRPSYNAGFKHLISLDGSASLPIPHAPNITVGEVGFSLILDLDDIVSLPNVWDDIAELVDAELPKTEIRTPEGITEEGIAGYFTYGLNANVALSVQAGTNPLPFSGGIRFRLPLTEEHGTTGFNNDVSFDASASALTLSVPYLGEVSAVTINQNGNINPRDAQLSTCLACTSSLEVKATLADITFNITKGEFNTGFLSELADRLLGVDEGCASPGSQCQIPAQGFSDVWIEYLYGSFAKVLEGVAEYLGIIAPYTPYEHTSPDPGNPLFAAGYINGIERITGGHDVNGDGRGDMVFPAGSAGGIPLQIWTTGDSHENRKYFLELHDLTEGWEIRPDTGKWHEGLSPELNDPSEDAVWRVDFETLALSANQTHWLVTAADDAPNSGRASFRLVHNRSLLGGGRDMLVDEVPLTLVKDRELTDLSVEVAVSHDPVASGEILTYTLNVHNEGPDAADDVELHLRNAVMHGLVLTGASTSGGAPPSCSELADAKGYACRLGDLGAGETIVVTLEFELALSLADGETFNTLFAVMSHTEDLALENNSAAAASTVRVAERVVLDALYNATGGRNWSHQRDWLSGEPIGDWYGVTTDGIGRVTALDLYQNHLTGTIPPELAGLPSLKQLHLSGNGLSGEIPGELGGLTQLEQLIASSNRLSGEMPPELGDLGSLTWLHLSDNQLTGGIPAWLGRLSRLERLSLSRNQMTGQIPAELGGLPNLQFLRLQGNQLTGCIPAGLRDVPDNDLDELGLADCASGDAATDRAALVALYNATGGANWRNNGNWLSNAPMGEWHGVTTDSDGRVTDLHLIDNQLTGAIPAELGYLTKLELLALIDNRLTGSIPAELGYLTNVEVLALIDNRLTGSIPAELGYLTNVEFLGLGGNQLTGSIPAELGNLTNLTHLDLYRNQLTGEIPAELGSLTSLRRLRLEGNQLTGSIPAELGGLTNLERLYLFNNQLTGSIPVELGNLTNLTHLYLYLNQLTGAIPAELGSLTNLELLDLSDSQLTGAIPAELGSLTSLRRLYLFNNQLTGEIPAELANLANLQTLHLYLNQLTGEIPAELGDLSTLEYLYLSGNQLTGEIPAELGNLTNLKWLDLEGNQLTGCIPEGLRNIRVNDFGQLGLPFCGS